MVYVIYSFLFYFIGFLIVNQNRSNRLVLFWLYLGIVVFWGASYHYAVDTDGYIDYFYNEVRPFFRGMRFKWHGFEPGFNLLASICK